MVEVFADLNVVLVAVILVAESPAVLLFTIAFVEVIVSVPLVVAGGRVVDLAAVVVTDENDSADDFVKPA